MPKVGVTRSSVSGLLKVDVEPVDDIDGQDCNHGDGAVEAVSGKIVVESRNCSAWRSSSKNLIMASRMRSV